ncbi:MAG: hypothetical protein ACM3MK_01440 [Chitinophagales bacterium]
MKRVSLLIIAMLLFMTPVSLAVQTNDWPYSKTLTVKEDGTYRVEFDKEILDHLGKGSNVRITDSSGLEIPCWQLASSLGLNTPQSCNPEKEKSSPGSYEATFTLPSWMDKYNVMVLNADQTPPELRQVTIEGSNDGINWNRLYSTQLWLPFTQSIIRYPENSYRYIHLSMQWRSKTVFNLYSINAGYLTQFPALTCNYPVKIVSVNPGKRTNSTVLEVDTGDIPREIQTISLQLANPEEYLPILRSVAQNGYTGPIDAKYKPMSIPDTTEYGSIQFFEVQNNSLVFYINSSHKGKIKFILESSAGIAPKFKSISLTGIAPGVMARLKAGKYTLWYGNSGIPSPKYDLVKIPELVGKNKIPVITPGPAIENPNYINQSTTKKEVNSWTLFGIIILLAAASGVFLIRNLRRTKTS